MTAERPLPWSLYQVSITIGWTALAWIIFKSWPKFIESGHRFSFGQKHYSLVNCGKDLTTSVCIYWVCLLCDSRTSFERGSLLFVCHQVDKNTTRSVYKFTVIWIQQTHQNLIHWNKQKISTSLINIFKYKIQKYLIHTHKKTKPIYSICKSINHSLFSSDISFSIHDSNCGPCFFNCDKCIFTPIKHFINI